MGAVMFYYNCLQPQGPNGRAPFHSLGFDFTEVMGWELVGGIRSPAREQQNNNEQTFLQLLLLLLFSFFSINPTPTGIIRILPCVASE